MANPSRKYFRSQKPLRKTRLRMQAQPTAPTRNLLSMDGVSRRKKDDKNHQQGNGSGMRTAHPPLPEIAERPSRTSAKSSRRGAVGILFHVAAKKVEEVLTSDPDLWVIESKTVRLRTAR